MIKKFLLGLLAFFILYGAYYLLAPKYYFINKGIIRCNRITGTVEFFDLTQKKG